MTDDFRHLLDGAPRSAKTRRIVVYVVSSVGFVGGAIAFFKNIDTIEKVVPTAWEMVVSKPEVNVRDVKIDVTEYFPDTMGAQKYDYKKHHYFVRAYAVLEKKSMGRIENCKGELKDWIETRINIAPEATSLHWGRYDQPAKFEFVLENYPMELKDVDFRVLCDGIVSGWTSSKMNKGR